MFELVFMILLGVLFIYIGWRIWKKEHITLIHSYHYSKVKDRDIKPYTSAVGKAVIIMGTGMILTALIDYVTETSYGWIVFGIFFLWGFIVILIAQKKYNGGLF
ncbi:MAG: DUF3784 domain-containing protein [Firmicutes bacterium HGW-Firmicutes-3]|jgi:flagellar biosynthesis protein FlhB|nr:MAG: DUF3784 domain-containing protein [Firmicutes bacterium HGW-Firmicutes-3]